MKPGPLPDKGKKKFKVSFALDERKVTFSGDFDTGNL